MKGKNICKKLKEIRLSIAQSNDIDYTPAECGHKGDCSGTCPQCEKEVRYIERQLLRRQAIGKVAVVAVLALGATSIAPAMAQNQVQPTHKAAHSQKLTPVDCASNDTAAIIVRGYVLDEADEPLVGATINVLDKKGKATIYGTATDYYGQFALRISKGTKVMIAYVGCESVTMQLDEPDDNLIIKLKDDDTLLGAVFIEKPMHDVDADIYEKR